MMTPSHPANAAWAVLAFLMLAVAVPAADATQELHEFAYTGSDQTYVIPDGVFNIEVSLWGADSSDAYGAFVAASLPVTPGDVLTAVVGAAGQDCVGDHGSGAGRSALRLNGQEILTAGGAGGRSTKVLFQDCNGGNGGAIGGATPDANCAAFVGTGMGGSAATVPYVGGTHGDSFYGGGGECDAQNSGGGGGYFGGETGTFGGGGGSSYAFAGALNVVSETGASAGASDARFTHGEANGFIGIAHDSSCPVPPTLLIEEFDPQLRENSGLSVSNDQATLDLDIELPSFYYNVSFSFNNVVEEGLIRDQCPGVVCSASGSICRVLPSSAPPSSPCMTRYTVRLYYVDHCSFVEREEVDDVTSQLAVALVGDIYTSALVDLTGTFNGQRPTRSLAAPIRWIVFLPRTITVSSLITVQDTCECTTDADCGANAMCADGCMCACQPGFAGVDCVDVMPPTVTCPSSATLAIAGALATSQLGALTSVQLPTVVDNYSSPAATSVVRVITDPTGQDSFFSTDVAAMSSNDDLLTYAFDQLGEWQVAYTFVDAAGNGAPCAFTVLVQDIGRPVPQCPQPQPLLAQSYTFTPIAAIDNIDASPAVTSSGAPAALTATGLYTYYIVAEDASANVGRCNYTVIIDADAPACQDGVVDLGEVTITDGSAFHTVQSLPTPVVADANAGQPWSSGVDFSSLSHDVALPLQVAPADGVQTIGAFVFQDAVGNADTCPIVIRVVDATPPTISGCPSEDVVVEITNATAYGLYDVLSGIYATDNIDTAADLVFDARLNGVAVVTGQAVALSFGVAYTVDVRVVDAAGNFDDSCAYNITVVDHTPPTVLQCPSDDDFEVVISADAATIDLVASGDEARIRAFVVAADASGDPVTITAANAAGPFPGLTGLTYPVGTHQDGLLFTISDSSGNTAECPVTITVVDGHPPQIQCPPDLVRTTDAGQNHWGPAAWDLPTATDSVSAADAITIAEVTQLYGTDLSVAAATGRRVVEVSYSAVDAAGLFDNCTFTVTVEDPEDPVVTCQDFTLTIDYGNATATVTDASVLAGAGVTLADNVQVVGSTLQLAGTSGAFTQGALPLGVHAFTIVAQDGFGNTGECSFDVTVTPLCGDGQVHSPETCDGTLHCSADTCTCPAGFASVPGCPDCAPACDGDCFTALDACTVTITTGNATAEATFTHSLAGHLDLAALMASEDLETLLGGFKFGLSSSLAADEFVHAELCCDAPLSYTPTMWRVADGCAADLWGSEGVSESQNTRASCAASTAQFEHSSPYLADQCWMWHLCEDGPFVIGKKPGEEDLLQCTGTGNVTLVATPGTSTASFTVDVDAFATLNPAFELVSDPADRLPNLKATLVVEGAQTEYDGRLGPHLVSIIASDSLNTDACTFFVHVVDSEVPTLTCPPDLRLPHGLGVSTVTLPQSAYETATAADAFDGDLSGMITYDIAPAEHTTLTAGVLVLAGNPSFGPTDMEYTVTASVADAAGNSAFCQFTIRTHDDQPPQIACPADIVMATNATSVVVSYPWDGSIASVLSSDNFDAPQELFTAADQVDVALGQPVTLRWDDADSTGNAATECVVTITVTDGADPQLTCPQPTTSTLEITDADGGSVALTWDLTHTAVDNEGSCTGDVCTGTLTQETCAYLVSDPAQTCIARGTPVGVGLYQVDIRVAECNDAPTCGGGDADTCAFQIEVVDATTPHLECPAEQLLYTGSAATVSTDQLPSILAHLSSSDLDLSSLTFTVTQQGAVVTGDALAPGQYEVQYAAYDLDGHGPGTCVFTVVVVDNADPTLACPGNVTLYTLSMTAADYTYAYQVTATDNVDGALTPTLLSGAASPAFLDVGEEAFTYGVTDAAGRTASCSWVVTVIDNTPPQCVAAAAASRVELAANASEGTVAWTVQASDNHVATTDLVITSLAPSNALGSTGSLLLGPGSYAFSFQTCQVAAAFVEPVCGAACPFVVEVVDVTPPTVTCPADQEVRVLPGNPALNNSVVLDVAVEYPVAAFDNVVSNPNLIIATAGQPLQSAQEFAVGEYEITATAVDTAGLIGTCSYTLTVLPPHAAPGIEAVLTAAHVVLIEESATAPSYGILLDLMTLVTSPHRLHIGQGHLGEGVIGEITEIGPSSCPANGDTDCIQTWDIPIDWSGCEMVNGDYFFNFYATCQAESCSWPGGVSGEFTVKVELSVDNFCAQRLSDVRVEAELFIMTPAELSATVPDPADTSNLPSTAVFSQGASSAALVHVSSPDVLLDSITLLGAHREAFSTPSLTNPVASQFDIVVDRAAVGASAKTDADFYATFVWTDPIDVPVSSQYTHRIVATVEIEYKLGDTINRRLLSLKNAGRRGLLQQDDAAASATGTSVNGTLLMVNVDVDASGVSAPTEATNSLTVRVEGRHSTAMVNDMAQVVVAAAYAAGVPSSPSLVAFVVNEGAEYSDGLHEGVLLELRGTAQQIALVADLVADLTSDLQTRFERGIGGHLDPEFVFPDTLVPATTLAALPGACTSAAQGTSGDGDDGWFRPLAFALGAGVGVLTTGCCVFWAGALVCRRRQREEDDDATPWKTNQVGPTHITVLPFRPAPTASASRDGGDADDDAFCGQPAKWAMPAQPATTVVPSLGIPIPDGRAC